MLKLRIIGLIIAFSLCSLIHTACENRPQAKEVSPIKSALSTDYLLKGKWVKLDSPTHKNLYGVDFLDAEHGWVVGEDGTILNTQDGGKTWKFAVSGSDAILRDVDFIDAEHGWVVGDNGLEGGKGGKTVPKGEPTHYVRKPGHSISPPSTILHTDDGGKTWHFQSTPTNFILRHIQMIDHKIGYIVSGVGHEHADGDIIYTDTGGANWRLGSWPKEHAKYCARNAYRTLWNVFFIDRKIGWVVGSSVLLDFESAKENSKKLNMPIMESDKGNILQTKDGGETWTAQMADTKGFLTGVFFVNESTGWVIGEGGGIFHTTDDGKHWNEQNNPISNDLTAIKFINPVCGWAVGKTGTVLFTTDGGEKWLSQPCSSNEDLNGMVITANGACYIVGNKGVILKYCIND